MSERKRAIQINPLDITESLGYTTYRRDSRKPWTKEEDSLLGLLVHNKLIDLGLKDGVQSLTLRNNRESNLPTEFDWEEVAEKLETRKAKDCRKRWTNSLDPTLKKGKWTTEEDQLLLSSFNRHGPSWQKISLEIPGRTDDQCAKRYIEVLDPNTKDRLRPWTIQEDLELIRKVKSYGTKWRTISLEMHSRPSLTCRNRWRKIVTDVVRGKAHVEIKREIDTMKGGLSVIEKINDALNKQNGTPDLRSLKIDEDSALKENVRSFNSNNRHAHRREKFKKTGEIDLDSLITPLTSAGSPSFPGEMTEPSKPVTTDIDWKYTLKDTSGLSVSNGNISTTELAKELVSSARKYDLKISIHQHIHHHYSPVNGFQKGTSPEDSTSQHSSQPAEEIVLPNRYSHFNYLPPMVSQPQLESSSSRSAKESDLLKLLNPSSHQYEASHSRRLSGSSNGSHSHKRHQHSRQTSKTSDSKRRPSFNHEELEDELDFWETMRSLSQVVDKSSGKPERVTSSTNNPSNDFGIYYGIYEGEEDLELDEELRNDIRDMDGILPGGMQLPFNPS